ncbi:thioesterase superfamily protein [Parafrankia sp. EAN1pec]|uniref:PaaI family thioesterase n=1 Tax=Parafrankia sp. (strain EAN1pec) TaxID=298653 RepID=UPI0000543DC3|nr:thioesterase superfamily protein [Frankia sp. EAN1pec]
MTTTNSDERLPDAHIINELGFRTTRVGDELHGSAAVVPEMFVPGTTSIRTSILATWADIVAGYMVLDFLQPRVPVTLDLDIHVHEPLRELERVDAAGRLVKKGQSVAVIEIELTGADGRGIAAGVASFMAAPDPAMLMDPEMLRRRELPVQRGRLRVPFAERARCEIREPGVAVLAHGHDGLNASRSLNGGLIALAAEEAALSLAAGPTNLSVLALRYLRPVRTGPAVATATVGSGGLGKVEVRDSGDGDRLAVYAVTRTFPAAAGRGTQTAPAR